MTPPRFKVSQGAARGSIISSLYFLKDMLWDCPGGSVVKNPSANVGDMGSIPDPGRSHVLPSN